MTSEEARAFLHYYASQNLSKIDRILTMLKHSSSPIITALKEYQRVMRIVEKL